MCIWNSILAVHFIPEIESLRSRANLDCDEKKRGRWVIRDRLEFHTKRTSINTKGKKLRVFAGTRGMYIMPRAFRHPAGNGRVVLWSCNWRCPGTARLTKLYPETTVYMYLPQFSARAWFVPLSSSLSLGFSFFFERSFRGLIAKCAPLFQRAERSACVIFLPFVDNFFVQLGVFALWGNYWNHWLGAFEFYGISNVWMFF